MIKVKTWKKITEFQPIKNGELDVNGTVALIAEIENVPEETVEEMKLSDLLPKFLECVSRVNREIFAKINELPKNGAGDGK